MTNKERASLAVAALKKEYPDSICSLTYRDPLQLLISTRLAAQCTDLRVNMVTPKLFSDFPDVCAFADAGHRPGHWYDFSLNQIVVSDRFKGLVSRFAL